MTRSAKMFAALAIAGALASVVWAAISVARHMAGVVVLEALPLPVTTHTAPQRDLSALQGFNPFGQSLTPVATSPGQARPEITLRGIFAAKNASSTALLDVDGKTELYRLGMSVSGALIVSEITAQLVRLTDENGSLTLRFDKVPQDTVPTSEQAQPDLLARMRESMSVPAKYQRPGKPETTSEYIDYWRHRIRKNPQAVLDEIGLRATDAGYVIADRHDVGVRLAGLRSGDLVRVVNGVAVGDPSTDRKLYDQIAAAGVARLEVERGGKTLSFSFPLR